MKHVFDELIKNNHQENLSFHDVNIEDDMAGVERLKIRSIPTIIVFKGDEEL
jgi:thioredoxin-like negative regulator of GroEL